MKQDDAKGGEAPGPAYKVNVLERAASILHAFSLDRPSLSLAEIARATDLHRSTVLRMLSTLVHSGLVMRDEETGQYSLGYEIIAMADIARAGTGVSDWARPVMKAIREELNETVVLSVRSGDFRVDVDQAIAQQAIRRVVALGEHKLLTVGAPSMAILSRLPEDELAPLLDRLRAPTLAKIPDYDFDALPARLAELRERGYHEHLSHFDVSGHPGSVGIAAPVLGKRGEVVAALGVSVPTGRYNDKLRDRIIAAVRRGAAETSARLGHVAGQAA